MKKCNRLANYTFLFALLIGVLSSCMDLSFMAPKEPVTITFWTFGDTEYFEGLIR